MSARARARAHSAGRGQRSSPGLRWLSRAGLLLTLSLLPSHAQSGAAGAYSSMTSAERRLVLRYFWQVPQVYRAGGYARDEAGARYPQLIGQDDQRDAFRHGLWNASMTRRLRSKRAAERWGDAHEAVPNNPAARRAMDLANNRFGREVAWAMRTGGGAWWRRATFPSDPQLASRLRAAVDRGELVMLELVGGQRDPHVGPQVPTRTP